MPHYKLTYFNIAGRARLPRFLFAIAGQDFENVTVDPGQWQAMKPNTPMGALPMLEVDGVQVSQSISIARYLGRQFGMAGKTDFEAACIDMVADTIVDMVAVVLPAFAPSATPQIKEEIKEKFEGILPSTLINLENLLKNDDYFGGSALSWADVFFYSFMDSMQEGMQMKVPWEKAPNAKKVFDKVAKIPKLVAWRAKNPNL